KVRFSLPDTDVFVIDATASPPQKTETSYTGVGTVLFNMIVNPVTGKVYVANTDANNINRFEGPGVLAMEETGLPSVRGHLAESHHPGPGPAVGQRRAGGKRPSGEPQPAHQLLPLLRSGPQRRERQEPGLPAGDGHHGRRQDALRDGVRLQQGGRLPHP